MQCPGIHLCYRVAQMVDCRDTRIAGTVRTRVKLMRGLVHCRLWAPLAVVRPHDCVCMAPSVRNLHTIQKTARVKSVEFGSPCALPCHFGLIIGTV